jgi:hypothetical protein
MPSDETVSPSSFLAIQSNDDDAIIPFKYDQISLTR